MDIRSDNNRTGQNRMREEQNVGRRARRCLPDFVFVVIGILIDQYTKHLAAAHLKGRPAIPILDRIFELRYLENRGAAFGLFQNQRFFFLLSVVVVTGAILWFYARVPLERRFAFLRFCAVAILAGAFGNCIDRLKQGYVVDFFYFRLIDFPIFNVADIYVTVAAFALFFALIFYYKEEDIERILHSGKRSGRADR